MASFNVDSELMNTWVAALPVPATRDFKVLKDGNGRPMLLSIGNDGILYLVASDGEGQSGTHRVRNLTEALGLDKSSVSLTCFDAVQSVSTGMIYIALAAESSGNFHRLLLLRPFDPAAVDVLTIKFSELIIPQKVNINPVKKIYMGNPDTEGNPYPAVIISYEPADRLQSQAIAGVVPTDDLESWTLQINLKLGENADKIIDLCCGTLGGDKGVFTLYSIQGQLKIKFTALFRLRETSAICPPGAARLASVFKSNGETDLVVGGNGLFYFTSSDLAFKDTKSITLSTDPLVQDLTDLEVSVGATGNDPIISIFTANESRNVAYISSTLKTLVKKPVVTVPLLPEGQGGYFSSFLDSDGNQSLVVGSPDGTLTLLEQAKNTGLWKRAPFNVKSLDENIELTCYQTHVSAVDSTGSALAGGSAILTSDGSVMLTVNGVPTQLTPSGIPVKFDSSGTLTIVCPTEDVSAYTYQLSEIQDRDGNDLPGTVEIDPGNKIHQRMLALVQSKDTLKNAKSESGQSLLQDSGNISDEDLATASTAMKELLQARVALSAADNAPTARTSSVLARIIASSPGAGGDSWIEKAESGAWQVWFWVEKQYQNIKRWAIRVVNDAREFIIEISGKVLRFVLDTVTNISKALSWFWNNIIKVGWRKLVDFVGFIFSWHDILETKNSTYNFVDSALQAGVNKIDNIANGVDGWFLKMENYIRTATMPEQLASTRMANAASTSDATDNEEAARVGWTKYQLGHGGAAKNSQVVADNNSADASDELSKLFHKYVDTILLSVETTYKNVGNKLVMLFNDNNKVSTGTILQALGSDLLVGIIDLLRAFVVDLVRLGADIIRGLRGLLTMRIKVPVFTKLYESISGKACNVLDIVSLILAIPITILSKVITGKKPPMLPEISPDTYTDIVSGGSNTDAATQLKFNQMSSTIGTNALSLQAICDMVEIAGSFAPVGIGAVGAAGGGTALFSCDYKLVFGVIARAAGFPTIKGVPGLEVALIIWGLATVATFVRAAIRQIEKSNPAAASQAAADAKLLAGVEIALAAISTGLWAADSALEYTSTQAEYPQWQKDVQDTSFKLTGAVLSQLGTMGTAIAVIDTEPITKGIAGGVSGICSALSYGILASRHYRALGNGKYATVLNKI